MSEIKRLLERQARWQKGRKALSWPEKIRMAKQMQALAVCWRSIASKNAIAAQKSKEVQT